MNSKDKDILIGIVAIMILMLVNIVFGQFYATILLLFPSIYSLYNKDYKSAKLLLVLPLVVILYIWKEQNTYHEDYINNMAYEMDISCVLDMEEYYQKKGYTLRWISRKENSSKEYAMGEQKWALPFLSSTRYDMFNRNKCIHIAEVPEKRISKSMFNVADDANNNLYDEKPETIYFR